MSRAGRGLLLALGLWLLLGHALVLPAIERGGLPWLVDLAGHPPEIVARFVSNLVARVALVLTFAALLVGLGPRRLGLTPFFERYVGPARPEVLGFLRFTTASILFISVAWEDVAGSAALPASMRDAHGLFAWVAAIPGFDAFSSDASALENLTARATESWRTRSSTDAGTSSRSPTRVRATSSPSSASRTSRSSSRRARHRSTGRPLDR